MVTELKERLEEKIQLADKEKQQALEEHKNLLRNLELDLAAEKDKVSQEMSKASEALQSAESEKISLKVQYDSGMTDIRQRLDEQREEMASCLQKTQLE